MYGIVFSTGAFEIIVHSCARLLDQHGRFKERNTTFRSSAGMEVFSGGWPEHFALEVLLAVYR